MVNNLLPSFFPFRRKYSVKFTKLSFAKFKMYNQSIGFKFKLLLQYNK